MAALPKSIAPDLHTTTLVVPGMHCAGCMGKVERGLGALTGVGTARVNLSARQVTVTHDDRLDVPALVAALDGIGFASQPRGEEMAPPPSAVKPLLAPLAVAGFACMNVMLLSVSVWSGAGGATRDLFHWLSAAIGIPAILYSGRVFFASAWSALRHGRTNMDVPISIGVVLATGLSFYEVLTHGTDAWFDGTLMLLLFLLVGRVLDAMMRDRARAGVDALLRQAASGAMVVGRDGALQWLAACELLPGMVIRVGLGERLAADGVICAGRSRFDQSLLTGESAPVPLGMDGPVHAGMLNLDAPVDVRVTAAGADTTLADIARLMEAAGQHRSRYVRIADRASRLYAPAVHTLAALSFAGWLLAGAGLYHALVIAISVLIITCPCALGLAVPVAQVVASGALMRVGVMVKDGGALERIARVDRALIDKTGTLTLGRPVPDPQFVATLPDAEASVALALASHSRHPLSQALAQALAARGVAGAVLEDVVEVPGEGVKALWQGHRVALRRPDGAQARRGMVAAIDIAGQQARVIPFADRLRADHGEALGWLHAMGVRCEILSGDRGQSVIDVACETGLFARAGVSPQGKLDAIASLQRAGHHVLMAGDGLNDGPALAAADASIAPSSASDVGRQAADFVFMGDGLLALPRAVAGARATMRVVRQNFALAIGYNILAVPLAMTGHVTPLLAAVAMSGSSLVVIGNSLRLALPSRWNRAQGEQARGEGA
ncbi:MAG: cadmium-translocating P-type ATPase [Sphingomonadales bacterium]|nr:cadmium-translocating P-type ATPase [Sphingomonadales bacterium]MDE2169709.1 cadmium-translocating P-type ATPase [Sphingomonadales bacterium]